MGIEFGPSSLFSSPLPLVYVTLTGACSKTYQAPHGAPKLLHKAVSTSAREGDALVVPQRKEPEINTSYHISPRRVEIRIRSMSPRAALQIWIEEAF